MCGAIGTVLLISIFFNVLGLDSETLPFQLFLIPGKILFAGFFLASFYIPLFLYASMFLLIKRPFNPKNLLLLVLSVIPFFTFSFLLKVAAIDKTVQDSVSLFFHQKVGVSTSVAFIVSLLALELFMLIFVALKKQSPVVERTIVHKGNAVGTVRYGITDKEKAVDNISSKRELVLSVNRLNRRIKENEHDKKKLQEAIENKKATTTDTRNEVSEKPLLSTLKRSLDRLNDSKSTPGKETVPVKAIADVRQVTDIPEAHDPAFPDPESDDTAEEKTEDTIDIAADLPAADFGVVRRNPQIARTEVIKHPVVEEIADDDDVPDLPEPPKKSAGSVYFVPADGLLNEYEDGTYWTIDEDTRSSGEILMETLKEFNITAEVTGIRKGPVITMFEILPAPGVKLSKITNLADNIALRLAASRVRIVAPIPGKHAVGIEVPNKKRAIVSFKELISLDLVRSSKYEIPIIIGKDIAGEAQIIDLVQTPHLLIAGATGSGKSVCVNSIICSILYTRPPEEVKLLLIDPKIVELKFYNDVPHLLAPVITEPKKAFQALQYCLCEMERRYSLLDSLGVRDVNSYNKKAAKKKLTIPHIPYIVILIDEFADLIANTGKDMEATIARLAAMSRAVGIHIVLATQRPSVEVITGLIKANIPSRIAFMVASKFDSRIIIDSVGAEKLLGKGDMLLSSAWDPVPVRIQGAYLAEEEVEAVSGYVKKLGEPDYIDDDIFIDEDDEDGDKIEFGENDPLMEKAVDIVALKGKASASYLQRRLKIGYNRAARIVEEMELRGIVGPANGSKPRDILHIPDRK
jgi:S-DNA-T family DNA segregation ATPase FtsK/SpoIIIE